MFKSVRGTFILGFILAFSGLLFANSLKFFEAYLKIKSKGYSCAEVLLIFDKLPKKPECKVIHKKSGTYRLRWEYGADMLAREILEEKKLFGVVEWYEMKEGGFFMESLGVIFKDTITSFLFNTLNEKQTQNSSWFVSDAVRKLQTLLEIHDAYHPVVIAIIDSGVNFDGDLKKTQKWINIKEINDDGLDNDSNDYIDDVSGWDFVETGVFSIFDDAIASDNNPSDRFGHGTAVAAIILETVGNSFKPYIQIMPLRVASGYAGSATVSPMALSEAIYYASDNGADIINISLAGNSSYNIVMDALQYALDKKIKIVAAAGNSGGEVYFPASMSGIVSVGATYYNGEVWRGSAYGDGVDIYAPGVNMLSKLDVNTFGISPDGTSFSAPVVSGVLAMFESLLGRNCNDLGEKLFSQIPVSKNIDDWIAVNAELIESYIKRQRLYDDSWIKNSIVCGERDVSVNSLMR